MSEKESPQHVIEAYRKRQQKSPASIVIMLLAGLLVIVGGAFFIFYLAGKSPFEAFAPKPTATNTATVTATATATATATSTATATATLPPPTDTPTTTSTPTASMPFIYVVKDGDTLSGIATQFSTTLEVLLVLNPNLDPNSIKPGDQILIPTPNMELPTATPLPPNFRGILEYRIVAGDTLDALALRFASTVAAIMKENPTLKNSNDIREGDIIKIPVNIVTLAPTFTPGPVNTPGAIITLTPEASSTPTPAP
jgi:LysM repeat protein